MHITSKGEYGLYAMFDLAQRYGSGPVPSRQIAERQRVPEQYLNQLLLSLRRAGLIQSTRGPGGGHQLTQPPTLITLAQVIHVLEGEYSPISDLTETLPADAPAEVRILHGVWSQVKAAVEGILESVTLADLCQRKLAYQQQPMYHI